ncbi:MAG: UvrD-helicase domain-containing protein [Proteobacteria bacterium]|nr:UvrD-helicase domain-containing protein [Pseudomonadota bacterium]
MKLVADLHVHSRFSRATSRSLDFVALHRAALEKGIDLLGTGDFTHPKWLAEITAQLAPAEDGLFRLKPALREAAEAGLPKCLHADVRFVLQVEISNIYKQADAVRKNHNLVYVPSIDAAESLSKRLATIGNIASDGRPILGLSARDLLEITLETHEEAFLIPAHIWTPWFSMLGAKSGFDRWQDCFLDLSDHIFAVETGLSSDPPMNWRLSALDGLTLVSNSDAHSAARLAREATLLDIDPSFGALRHALKTREGYRGTLEFYPEEGKYHLDGHRACDVRLSPEETRACGGLCPVCGKPVTMGVAGRIDDLADRPVGFRPAHAAPFENLVPLREVVAEVLGVTPGAQKAAISEHRLRAQLGAELFILRHAPLEDIAAEGGSALAEAVRRVRTGEIHLDGGFDGTYGTVRIFDPAERDDLLGQMAFFAMSPPRTSPVRARTQSAASATTASAPANTPAPSGRKQSAPQGDLFAFANAAALAREERQGVLSAVVHEPLFGLDPDQHRTATHLRGPLLVVAGPGTGKTRTLTARMAHQIQTGTAQPDRMLAIAFTRQAVLELDARLQTLLPANLPAFPQVTTFHGFGAMILKEFAPAPLPTLLDDVERTALFAALFPSGDVPKDALARISLAKQTVDPEAFFADDPTGQALFVRYEQALHAQHRMDIDDLVWRAHQLVTDTPGLAAFIAQRYQSISVDEYQDVNDVQASLVQRITDNGRTLMAIGDPDQAIYGFRGARPGHFTRFAAAYPDARTISLGTTYRLTDRMVRAAQGILAPAGAYRTQRHGVKVELMSCPSAASEAVQISRRIEQLVGGTSLQSESLGRGEEAGDFGFGDIAILVRTRAQRTEIAEALHNGGIPVLPVGEGEPFDPRAQKVALMTMHAAKGREFGAVFVAGVEPGIVPLSAGGLQSDTDEERRLLYVAITRARTLCILSWAAKRILFGEALPGGPSPFLSDVPADAVTHINAEIKARRSAAQLSLI